MATWLVCSSLECVVRVQALASPDSVLRSWARRLKSENK